MSKKERERKRERERDLGGIVLVDAKSSNSLP